jgi:hypothetical protein
LHDYASSSIHLPTMPAAAPSQEVAAVADGARAAAAAAASPPPALDSLMVDTYHHLITLRLLAAQAIGQHMRGGEGEHEHEQLQQLQHSPVP